MIATFVQDKINVERGLFDEELVPEELIQLRIGKIIGRCLSGLNVNPNLAIDKRDLATVAAIS